MCCVYVAIGKGSCLEETNEAYDNNNVILSPSPPNAGVEGDQAQRVDEETQSHGLRPAQAIYRPQRHQQTCVSGNVINRNTLAHGEQRSRRGGGGGGAPWGVLPGNSERVVHSRSL